MLLSPVLSVTNVTVFDSERTFFRDISFCLNHGETIAVMGPSGIGKSMLSKAVAGFLPTDVEVKGNIEFNGQDVVGLGLLQRAHQYRPAVIFQDALKALNPISTVAQQLSLALTGSRSRLKTSEKNRVLNMLSHLGFSDSKAVLSKTPSQLSGGQRQRICIAIALLSQADLVIADEPTSALDPITEAEILNLLHASVKKKQICGMLITHDLAAALACDKLVVIADGTMVAYGPPYQAILQSRHPFCQQLSRLLPSHIGAH